MLLYGEFFRKDIYFMALERLTQAREAVGDYFDRKRRERCQKKGLPVAGLLEQFFTAHQDPNTPLPISVVHHGWAYRRQAKFSLRRTQTARPEIVIYDLFWDAHDLPNMTGSLAVNQKTHEVTGVSFNPLHPQDLPEKATPPQGFSTKFFTFRGFRDLFTALRQEKYSSFSTKS